MDLSPDPPVLEIDLEASLGGFTLRAELTMRSRRLVIWGPSGAGKSITLRLIAGLIRPRAGRVAVRGRTLFDSRAGIDLPPRRRRVGLVFQDYALFPHLSVAGNLAFGLGSRADAAQRVLAMARRMEIEDLLQARPDRLSGGQRQRVALARALLAEPELLLMDEPFNSLDTALRDRVRRGFVQLTRDLDLPLVLVTHDPEEVRALAHEVAVFRPGRCRGVFALPPDPRRLPAEADPLLLRLESALEGEPPDPA